MLTVQLSRLQDENNELKNEIAKLTRNTKCAGCAHSKENHDSSGCLVWIHADASRKCLCMQWTGVEKREEANTSRIRNPTAHDLHGYKHELGPCVCNECSKKGFP